MAHRLPETYVRLPRSWWPKGKGWENIEDPVVPLRVNLYGHPLAGLIWEKSCKERLYKAGFELAKGWESLYVHKKSGIWLSVYVDDFHMAGPEQEMKKMWKILDKHIDLDPPNPFNNNVFLGCEQEDIETKSLGSELIKQKSEFYHYLTQKPVDTSQQKTPSHPEMPLNAPKPKKKKIKIKIKISEGQPCTPTGDASSPSAPKQMLAAEVPSHIRAYVHKMKGQAEQAVLRYLELAKTKASTLKKVPTPCIEDHALPPEDFTTRGELSPVAARIVLKALYLARLLRIDCYWTVNNLAREVTRWTVACDKRLHRLISYIHHTADYVLTSFVGDEPEDCYLTWFSDASFAGDLRDSKSTTGGILCIVGPNTYVPITWICKKRRSLAQLD